MQRLLVPRILRLPSDLEPILEENRELFSSMGFEWERFGDGDIAVKSRPDILKEEEVEKVLIDALRALQEFRSTASESLEKALHPVLATIACHCVVRANQALSPAEAETLLDGLDGIQQGWTCPHGRPILFRLSFHSIEKHFERV